LNDENDASFSWGYDPEKGDFFHHDIKILNFLRGLNEM